MRKFALNVAVALAAASCSPAEETTGSVSDCVAQNFPSYNPKEMAQCVAACKKCQHGITTTCSTSCTLKGAH